MKASRKQTTTRTRGAVALVSLGLVVVLAAFAGASSRGAGRQLAPTAHPPLSATVGDMWLVPAETAATTRSAALYQPLTDAVAEIGAGNYERALALLNRPSLGGSALADYASYYKGIAQLRLSRAADARATFEGLGGRELSGYLAVATPLGEAEAVVALGDHARALAIYEKLTADKTAVNEQILARQAEEARVLGDRRKAAEALLRIYYEFPLTDAAVAAGAELEPFRDIIVRQGYKRDLGRALQLYGARRYSDARAAFVALQGEASGDDRELVDLRVAESDFFLQRHQAALDGLRPWLDRASRQAEARFFHLSALRGLGRDDEFLSQTDALIRDFPESTWSEEALNNLGTYYILKNDDEMAAKTFDQLYAKFPNGQRADRAAWKSGWWAYKHADYAGTVRVFEGAAASFPRSDYRPLFLYWSARSYGKLGSGADAESRLRLVVTDYGNSYYGRLAGRHLSRSAQTALERRCHSGRSTVGCRAGCRSTERERDPTPPGERSLRRRAERAPFRAAQHRVVAGHRGDDRVGLSPERGTAAGHHADAPRVSAAPDGGSGAAEGDPAGHLSADLLGSHPQARCRAQSRSVSGGGAHRAGVHVRRRGPIDGECVGADADRAVDWPPARTLARHPAVYDQDADQPGNERPDGHAVLLAAGAAVRWDPLRARQLQRGREPSGALEVRDVPAWTKTSSSTTFRFRRPRTTSNAF